MVTVTRELILSGQTPAGGWKRAQLYLIGVGWPPPRGWMGQAVGREINEAAATRFVELGGRTPEAPPSADTLTTYSDGGVIGVNPSPIGGTFAWCHVLRGQRVAHASGHVTPDTESMPSITNNYTELLAAVLCLEALPDGWDGVLYTDSLITLRRVTPGWRAKFAGIPEALRARVTVVKVRLGKYQVRLLGGHPTRRELEAGCRADGKPVSSFNVWCDEACGREARKFREGVTS